MPRKSKKQEQPAGIGQVVGSAIGGALDKAVGSVGTVGKVIGSAIRLPGFGDSKTKRPRPKPGSRPGIEHAADVNTPPAPGVVKIHCIDYCPDRVESFEVDDLDAFFAKPKPDDITVRWINVDGLHPYTINRFKQHFKLHTLAAEDTFNTTQRPKVEPYDEHLFIVTRMLRGGEAGLISEQVSFYIQHGLLITFQEEQGDVWQPIRDRINTKNSRLRTHDVGFLLYALLDAMVDHCFPLLEQYGDLLERIELVVIKRPTPALLQKLHGIKRELATLRRVMWPMRDVVDNLYRGEYEDMSAFDKTYLRDVYDHVVQIIDIIETFRDMAGGLTDLYMSAVSNRMNEIMKVLTIMASIFVPITFIAGVYGMNFEHIPELHYKNAYYVFWIVCSGTVLSLLIFFYRKGWIGRQ